VTLKEALIGTWINEPICRNPQVIENWLGVEVSACTKNARRRRLRQILGSSVMKGYLEGIKFEWHDPDCKSRYFQAVRSDEPLVFQKLYCDSDKQWRNDIGGAVAICFKAIMKTGLGSDSCLTAFWVSDSSFWTASFNQRDYSWIGMLKDTPTSSTVAIIADKCLVLQESTRKTGAFSCNPIELEQGDILQSTCLETALIINEEAKIPPGLEKRRTTQGANLRWSVSGVSSGERFSLGDYESIKVIRGFSRGQLLVSWETHNGIHHFLRRWARKDQCKFHWERIYTLECPITPIPIYIVKQQS